MSSDKDVPATPPWMRSSAADAGFRNERSEEAAQETSASSDGFASYAVGGPNSDHLGTDDAGTDPFGASDAVGTRSHSGYLGSIDGGIPRMAARDSFEPSGYESSPRADDDSAIPAKRSMPEPDAFAQPSSYESSPAMAAPPWESRSGEFQAGHTTHDHAQAGDQVYNDDYSAVSPLPPSEVDSGRTSSAPGTFDAAPSQIFDPGPPQGFAPQGQQGFDPGPPPPPRFDPGPPPPGFDPGPPPQGFDPGPPPQGFDPGPPPQGFDPGPPPQGFDPGPPPPGFAPPGFAPHDTSQGFAARPSARAHHAPPQGPDAPFTSHQSGIDDEAGSRKFDSTMPPPAVDPGRPQHPGIHGHAPGPSAQGASFTGSQQFDQYDRPIIQPGVVHQPASGATSLDEVALHRRARRAPNSGWRRAVHRMSGGAINPGDSRDDVHYAELVERVQQPVRGDYRIAVLSLKGGVGKTTTSVGLGSVFSSLRGDRVIAVDANPDLGTLAQRIPQQTRSTVRDLLADSAIYRYSDVRAHTSQAPSRLEVLASERDPAVAEAFSDQDYRGVMRVLQRFYNIIITDCGTGLSHSAMNGVLDLANALILVSSPAIDGARSAGATLDWLQAHGYGHLVSNAVVVVSSSRSGASSVDINQLKQHFLTRCRAVQTVPFDDHLAEGAEVDLDLLNKHTRRSLVELAATVADDFSNANGAHDPRMR